MSERISTPDYFALLRKSFKLPSVIKYTILRRSSILSSVFAIEEQYANIGFYTMSRIKFFIWPCPFHNGIAI
jgi:hypothetical protein